MNLAELLVPLAVLPRLRADSAEQVIRQLSEILSQQGYVADGFVQAALDREREAPTGLPLAGTINAALPHLEPTFVLRPAVGLATLTDPVNFGHMVEKERPVPVRLVIMLAMDKPEAQVQMLQQVAGILQDPALVERIMACATREELLRVIQALPSAE
jgi:PTS system galactitol-specific IIA component